MAASGAPKGDETGPQQEGIWQEPTGARPQSSEPVDGASPGAGGRLAQRLTSTARTPGPGGLVYADVPNRVIALIIDILVLAVTGSVLALLLFDGLTSQPGAIDSSGGELDIVAFLIVLVLQLIVSLGYFAGTWTLAGSTIGMRMLSLRVGDEVDGQPISWRHSLVRWLILGIPALLASLAVYVPDAIGLILSALGVALLLLLLFTMAQSPTKQGLHDRYAHTILVKARRHSQ